MLPPSILARVDSQLCGVSGLHLPRQQSPDVAKTQLADAGEGARVSTFYPVGGSGVLGF